MKIALVSDSFSPQRTSCAVQLRDLSRELVRQGHELTVLLPAPDLTDAWQIEHREGYRIVRLKALATKDMNYVRRTIGEFLMPYCMKWNYRKSPLRNEKWEGVLWYSPSIFHGPLIAFLKKFSGCKSYLILRDIFPDWAVDMGLMGKGLPYKFFNAVAQYQYSVANVIGVQAHGNLSYFTQWTTQPGRKLEVLQNWLDAPAQTPCSIQVGSTRLAGRKVFVYAGNMGVAQGMDILLDLSERFLARSDVGFLFVGRGRDYERLRKSAEERNLHNVLFFEEIDSDEIPALYAQCAAGIVALDQRHKSHNIPGKFLTYMQCGLPVLANINQGNDLANIIRNENVGQVSETNKIDDLYQISNLLLKQIDMDLNLASRCRNLFEIEFSVNKAATQILGALK